MVKNIYKKEFFLRFPEMRNRYVLLTIVTFVVLITIIISIITSQIRCAKTSALVL